MSVPALLPVDRFVHTLDVVFREGGYMAWSRERLFARKIDQRETVVRLGLAEHGLPPPLDRDEPG